MSIGYSFNTGVGFNIISSSGNLESTASLDITSSIKFTLGATGSEGTQFQILIPSGSTGENVDTTALFITSSGKNPLIGIGTSNPIRAFDVQETQDDSSGAQFLIRSARTAIKGADPGDAAGTINFIINSSSFSNIEESGSLARITTEVLTESDEGIIGKLIFQTAANEKLAPTTVMQLFNGQGGSSITSSLDVSSFLSADKIAVGTFSPGNVLTGGVGIQNDLRVDGSTILGDTGADTIRINGDLETYNGVQFNSLPTGTETTFLTVDGSGNVKTRASGADGSSGTSGSSGSSGTSGSSGSSGTSGSSGSSGTSGSSQVLQVHQDLQVRQVLVDLQAHQVLVGLQVQAAPQDHQVLQVHQDLQVLLLQ